MKSVKSSQHRATGLAISAIATLALRSAHGELPLKLGATSIEFESLKATTNAGIDNLEELEVQIKMLWDRDPDLTTRELVARPNYL